MFIIGGKSLFNFVREHYVLTWPSRIRIPDLRYYSTEFLQRRFDLDPILKNSGSDRVLNAILVSKKNVLPK
jgi:hypothetical protein